MVLVAALTAGLAVGTAVVVADDYSISVDGAIDTPTETVTYDGTQYEISALGTVEHGEPVAASVSIPADTNYDVNLLDSEGGVEAFASGTGSEAVTFETDDVDPGSYALVLYVDGANPVDVHPVVVDGYDVSLEHSTAVSQGDEIEIGVTVAEGELTHDPDDVEVAVWDDDTVVRENAAHDSGDAYAASVSTSELEVGSTYAVYAVAQGEDDLEMANEPEILAVSDESTVEITDADDGDDSTNGDGPGGGQEPGGDEPVDDEKGADDDLEDSDDDGQDDEPTDDESDDKTESDADDDPQSESDDSSDDGIADDDGSDGDETADNVVQPNEDDSSDTGAGDGTAGDADTVPMTAALILAVAVLLFGLERRVFR
ncbi:hypothetical protein [Natrarchaeobius oligotrophus]|uniref:Uncharacterized protein n=1 Tax=Natrarchaeobius chitinivorans TaxID=1679083 RepID=A0A3N6N0D9_NATCH|nr:hypothetical protein [Natrarchaeobius chitinivorans]RQH02272.1 hypothetical protein EA472_02930 [Natrarchaeobius chitinivorans]